MEYGDAGLLDGSESKERCRRTNCYRCEWSPWRWCSVECVERSRSLSRQGDDLTKATRRLINSASLRTRNSAVASSPRAEVMSLPYLACELLPAPPAEMYHNSQSAVKLEVTAVLILCHS